MRVPSSRLVKVVVLCFALSGTASAQTGGLLGILPILGDLPIIGPLISKLPIVGGLLSTDLLGLVLSGDDQPVRAIIRGDVAAIQAAAARDGIRVLRVLSGYVVVEATPSQLHALQGIPGIEAISRDALVRPLMSVSLKSMATAEARAGSGGLLGLGLIGATPSISGKGIGVAVIDSGIAYHSALSGKVVASVNHATGETSATDAFGHGTHIAGIIAGVSNYGPTSLFKTGVAPGAHLVNVRVLNRNGVGYTSDVIAGIQWVKQNRTKYAIRVINLSLGHPIVEPCFFDPLCLAAEDAVKSGLVVVASAGNGGKDAEGRPVLGSITTPGNAPSVITVGALNTSNTSYPSDDTVATYSSRGPTRYDLLLKPDVVAPGNKIVSLEAAGSYLAKTYPTLRVAGSGTNAFRMMSGTSMAAAMVSGGAALLLESSPTLTARQLKVALQVTAAPMVSEGLINAGTGRVNLYAARKFAAPQELLGLLPTSTISGELVSGSGLTYLATGAKVDMSNAGYAGLRVFGMIDIRKQPTTLSRTSTTGASQLVWGDVLTWTYNQQLVWGDQLMTIGTYQLVWGDQIFNPSGQQLVWGDQVYTPSGQQLVWGDAETTNANQLVWGDSTPGSR
jgi:serine protease AprX